MQQLDLFPTTTTQLYAHHMECINRITIELEVLELRLKNHKLRLKELEEKDG